jgi:cyclic 2,3-diphosphoglycerate synthetase
MPFVSNVGEGARMAVELGADLVILEGSGSSMPTVPWDAGVLVAPAGLPPEHLGGYLGPLRVLLCELVVFTMGVGPEVGPENLFALRSHVQRLRADARLVVTDLQPVPLGDVQGKRVFFATTAPAGAIETQVERLERTFGCRVVGRTNRLADRAALAEELDRAEEYDILVTELKAAAIDVAAQRALARGATVVFADNRPAPGGDGDLRAELEHVIHSAMARGADR